MNHLQDSEATRRLCAGAFIDLRYRSAVIRELYENEHRSVAPSLGFDATTVLAYCLRARLWETWVAVELLVAWVLFAWLGTLWALAYAAVCVALWCGAVLGGRTPVLHGYGIDDSSGRVRGKWRGLAAMPLLVIGRFGAVGYWIAALGGLFVVGFAALPGVLFPLGMAFAIGVYRDHVYRMMAEQLARDVFATPQAARPPSTGERFERIAQLIAMEQCSDFIMYWSLDPFLGAGIPLDPWSFAIELKPNGSGSAAKVSNRRILDLITPRVQALDRPTVDHSIDRLRAIEIRECIFLPAAGVPRSKSQVHAADAADLLSVHRAEATDEGGEKRRLFLRIMVDGWDGDLVTTVFVRVHTQGGMLALEFVPHVLPPIRDNFRTADEIGTDLADQPWRLSWTAHTLMATPSAMATAVLLVGPTLASTARMWLGAGRRRGGGPNRAVREMACDDELSLFQALDARRYIRTIQDRVVDGVRQALTECGYETDELKQQVVNIGSGGMFVSGNMSGASIVGSAGPGARIGGAHSTFNR